MVFVDFSDSEARHLARALRLYGDRLRVDGFRLPAGLAQMEARLGARSGQERTSLDGFEPDPDSGSMSLLYDYEDAGRALSVSPRTVRRLVQGGELRGVKIGSARRIHKDDLANFADRLRQGDDHEQHEEN